MKKIFTLLLAAVSTLTAFAKDYNCNLAVWVNKTAADPSQMNIGVTEQADGKYTLELKNFILYTEGMPLAVGNITVSDIDASKDESGNTSISTAQGITIEAGDAEGVDMWMGPMLCDKEPIEITLNGSITSTGILAAQLDIPFSGMEINVMLKSNNAFQIPNSDFEGWHKASYGSAESDEPNSWHSFMSCTGNILLVPIVSKEPHTFISNEVRPETKGKTSVQIKSALVLSASANGTITTGRLQAGSATAENSKNCSFLDLTNTDKDNNGDPFYTALAGHPDAIKVWVKYLPGNSADINATISAVVTDGTYYQDPEDKTYTNVVAKAKNPNIASNGGEWQELTVPFEYESGDIEPEAVLVTISTCAIPGGGSKDDDNPDVLYVDDLSLVYKSKLSDIKVFGKSIDNFDSDKFSYNVTVAEMPEETDFEFVGEGKGTFTVTSISGKTATITSMSEDYMEKNIYEINFTIDTSNISNISGNSNNVVVGTYNLGGQKVSSKSNGIYITKYADGKVVKSLKK